ncbi:hypothetical protein [Cellulomonas fimi]|uniref:Uncharacterized protein n=1 Tax=Cellulomonas fimi TaxID=1708 RepID=A0A7Y0LYW4_CELFI|nr:hypothetical protein [Cellulomonas fimi]NMR20484.1 hypothetical protein [Cellulomonas fimi]
MTGTDAPTSTGSWQLRPREVVLAWVTGFVWAVVATIALALVGSGQTLGPEAGTAGSAGTAAAVLGIVPALVIGLPAWFGLSRLLRAERRQWAHVLWFALVGLVLASAISAALFGQVITGGLLDAPGGTLTSSDAADLLRISLLLGAPWGVGAAVGRAAVIPLVRRRLAATPATMAA